ncbi:hypothetical protein CspeluHIS016_0205970 [Cutaneotrichosporon spelunceum]|uniref:Protoporphyrinogen oxidase n=1 Tax=Cutaneotrichosporon spelunceum TaxID=1672016 RepID=A0AAD3TRE0_9TREE|nr:hypothetical protein CspeluHIS016_0205970 [Cutaneotrichosporon spelunceum]
MPPRSVAVVGGGLSGLTAAYRLAQSGARVTLLDPAPRLGGWTQTQTYPVSYDRDGVHHTGTVSLEFGPRSIRPRGGLGAPAMLQLIHDVGLADAIVPIPNNHPAAKHRYIYDPERGLSAAPTSPLALLDPRTPPAIRALLLAVAREPFRRAPPPTGDESVASFFERRFGPRAARTASAFVHGIYAADPAALSLRSAFGALYAAEQRAGSVVRGLFRTPVDEAEAAAWHALGEIGKEREGWNMYALRGGMGRLTHALEEGARALGVDVRRAAVLGLTPDQRARRVNVDTSYGPLRVDHVVAALPPRRLHRLLTEVRLPHLLANSSTTVGVVNVVLPLPASAVHPPGFGYLIPRGGPNPEGALGVVFDTTALPGTDPGELDVTKLTVMLGGPHWNSYGGREPAHDDELAPLALSHLARVFPHVTVPPILVVPRLNQECIPTYAPGHGDRLREIHQAIITGGWAGRLSVVGAGYGGVSVNDCVLGAEMVAAGLAGGQVTGLERWADWE